MHWFLNLCRMLILDLSVLQVLPLVQTLYCIDALSVEDTGLGFNQNYNHAHIVDWANAKIKPDISNNLKDCLLVLGLDKYGSGQY